MSTPVKIFIAFSHEDNALEKKLKTALNPLVRLGHATLWDDFSVESGSDWKATIMQNLLDSGVVLLLFSPDAIASPYFMEEVEVAIERHKNGEAVAVPVILRPCAWQRVPHIAELEALPEKALPVTKWADTDDAFLHLFEAVEKLVERPKAKLEGKSTTETADLFALREADPFHDQMVFIEGGKFDMGDTFGEGLNPEKPVHPVTVPSFWLQKTAVSQAQWMKFMDYNPSNWKGDNLPVENVNWEEAQAFIEKVNRPASSTAFRAKPSGSSQPANAAKRSGSETERTSCVLPRPTSKLPKNTKGNIQRLVNTAKRRSPSPPSSPTLSAFTRCRATFGNGAPTTGTSPMTVLQATVRHGQPVEIPVAGWFVAGLGTTFLTSVARPTATGSSQAFGTTSSVFGWPGTNPLPFLPFTLLMWKRL